MDRPRLGDNTAGQIDGEADWWTTSGKMGLPPLARVKGMGVQQLLLSTTVLLLAGYSVGHVNNLIPTVWPFL